MLKKTIRFLSEAVNKNKILREQLEVLRKAYEALDQYCVHLIMRVDRLEEENRGLREGAECKPPASD